MCPVWPRGEEWRDGEDGGDSWLGVDEQVQNRGGNGM